MLGASPFYYQTTRRSVVVFGNLFKDLTLVKYNTVSREEISRRIVPLTYAAKENYVKRLLTLPELTSAVEFKLPAMSFELTGLEYDAARKIQSGLQNFNQTTSGSSVYNQYVGVPYNLHFGLYIYVRNIDDGLQIVEQILPAFNPDYTLTMDFIDDMNIVRNVPIILESVNMDTTYVGDSDEERRLEWTLNFTMQTTFYGPTISGGLITETITNINSLDTAPTDEVTLTIANTPLGSMQVGETVYQGVSLQQANAVATVLQWNPLGGQLVVEMTNGTFVSNANVYGTQFGSSVKVVGVNEILRFATIVDTPNPKNATNIYEDFGFSTYIVEFPATESYTPPSGFNPATGGGGTAALATGGSGGSGLFSDAYNQANAAYAQANAAYMGANTAFEIAALAYAQANSASGNNTTFGVLTANTVNIDSVGSITSNLGSTTLNNTTIAIDSFSAGLFNSVKYFIQLSSSQGIHTTELIAMQDGVNTYMTEYATLLSANSLGSFATVLSGTTFNLNYTPYNPSATIINYKFVRQTLNA